MKSLLTEMKLGVKFNQEYSPYVTHSFSFTQNKGKLHSAAKLYGCGCAHQNNSIRNIHKHPKLVGVRDISKPK